MPPIVTAGVVSICTVCPSFYLALPCSRLIICLLKGAPYQWAAILPKDALHIKTGYDDLHFYSAQHKKYVHQRRCVS